MGRHPLTVGGSSWMSAGMGQRPVMQNQQRVRQAEMLPSGGEPHPAATLDPGGGFTDRIRQVLASGGVAVVFQPVWDLQRYRDHDAGIVGFEVLARISDGGAAATPDVWFAAAAAASLETELQLAVARSAFTDAAGLPPGAYVSLNVSPAVAVAADFAAFLDSFPLDRMVLEVSQHATIDDYEVVIEALGGHRRRGLRLAIDDVGAGLASLSHVLSLDPDIIKIDLSIIRGVDADTARQSLTASFVSLAGVVGAAAVAEGIETKDELRTLLELGVDHGQGYLLTPPSPAARFTDTAA
ncbi:MAG: EAL domain-containing protein [Acidimicrobiia bacterium]